MNELLAEPNARPVCALRANFCRSTFSTNGVRRWIDGRELEQADQCKRIFGKGLGEPRAVSSASGTTILAAERTGRRGYAIELDPGHVDTAIARWKRMTS